MATTTAAPPATGTVYGLVDPRDDQLKYIGQTTKTLPERLRGSYARRVRSWIAELRNAGLRPLMVPIREDVPAGDLLVAESEEITRIVAAGGTLLNEQATALGRELLYERHDAERKASERAGWAELADLAMSVLGGPVPPGDLPEITIPDVSWRFMSKVGPRHHEYMRSLTRTAGKHELWRALSSEQDGAAEYLWRETRRTWGQVRGMSDDFFGPRMQRNFSRASETPCGRREDASQFLALIVWYMVAVDPWRHLAELAGLPMDDASFTRWAGQDAAVREALGFLAGRGDGMLAKLSVGRKPWEEGPGYLLGAVSAAYSDVIPAPAIRSNVGGVLSDAARDHMLTRPMADLLVQLDPGALDSAFGNDVARDLDLSLSLPAGTTGRVLQALVERLGPHSAGVGVRRAADRSAQTLPAVALPDYYNWSGRGVIEARAISGALVRRGLAQPDHMSPDDYLAEVHALWGSAPPAP